MKYLISATFVLALVNLSLQFYGSPPAPRLSLNQFVDKFPRKSVTRCPRQLTSRLPRKIVAMFLIPFALTSKSVNVRLPKELSKKLFHEDSVVLRPGETVRLLKIRGSSVARFRMSNVTMFQS